MNGIILSFLLSYFWAPVPDAAIALGEIEGGYHIGPIYGVVCIGTESDPVTIINNVPLTVFWDFKIGLRFDGFDFFVSRACQHNVWGNLPSGGGIRIVARWSSWP